MLKGRLGLQVARVPHADRHGLLWLSHGNLYVRDGTICFKCAGWDDLPRGVYDIPFQMVSAFLLGPGTTISHDVLRLCARHGTGVCAVGEDGVRLYTFPPLAPDSSAIAREQVRRWNNSEQRILLARKMYAWRLGEVLPHGDLNVLRGIEGARLREAYTRLAEAYGQTWKGRRYDRKHPDTADEANQAINHVVSAVEACAAVACAVTGAIPQLGFIHEDSGLSFILDVADLFRTEVTLPVAFTSVNESAKRPNETLERIARQLIARTARKQELIPKMIDRIKELFPCP